VKKGSSLSRKHVLESKKEILDAKTPGIDENKAGGLEN